MATNESAENYLETILILSKKLPEIGRASCRERV